MYNVVYINTHDTGRYISPYGYDVPTLNLEEFAKDSTLFTHAYCLGPTCSPSRAGMLTGTYPHQNGMYGLAQRGFSLNNPSNHLANFLKSKGYQTAISGIQHEVGWYLDLDVLKVQELGYTDVLTTSSKEFAKENLHIWDRNNVDKAIDWLKNIDKTKPFLLSYGLHSTHRPFPIDVDGDIDERYVKPVDLQENNEINRHDFAQFMTSVKYADENINLLIDALKKTNLYDSTIIIYTTDHGLAMPFYKCNLTDLGIGVSLIIRHPKYGHGKVIDGLVSQVDVFPTICELLEIDKPSYLEGISFAKTFNNQVTDRKYVFAEVNFHTSYEPIRCIRNERFKYIKYFDDYELLNLSNIDDSNPKSFLMQNGLRSKHKQMEALYDCYYDNLELNNVIDDSNYQEVLQELKKELYNHMVRTKDPLLEKEFEILSNYKVNKKECLSASSKDPKDYDERGRR